MTATELKALRVLTGLSQESFGVTVLRVSGRTVARWENGSTTIDGEKEYLVRARVADWLGGRLNVFGR